MKPAAYVATVLSAAVSTVVALLIIRAVGYSGTSMAFVVAAIIGTNVAVFVHHRSGGAALNGTNKAQIGASLALTALVVGGALQLLVGPFAYPEVTIPIAMVGSFVFPWAIADTMWKALEQKKSQG
jgi:hypothetical protein